MTTALAEPSRARPWLGIGLALLATACGPTPTATLPAGPTRTPIRLGPTSTAAPTVRAATLAPATPTLAPLPPVSGADWRIGPPSAAVRLLVYSDFQSSTAAQGLRVLLGVHDRHPQEVEIVFRHFPVVAEYDKDSIAAQAAEAAGRQGRFWAMARLLADRHTEWSLLAPEDFRRWLDGQAAGLGLDPGLFADDLDAGRHAALMVAAFQEALAAGIPGVPTIFLNGDLFRASPTELNLEGAVRLEILAARQFSEPPGTTIREGTGYTAFLQTSIGEIVIQLLPETAPSAVNSFVFLAGAGWFDGNLIYRVEPGLLVETGDPSATGLGGPGYHLPDEIPAGNAFDRPGAVVISSVGPGTGGSRFVITLRPVPEWEGTRTVFGRVIEGLDLLENLEARDPATDLLTPGAVVIRRVRIQVQP